MFTKEYIRKWKLEHPKARTEIDRRWVARNRDRKNAQLRVQYAIRRGYIKRQPCKVCGKPNAHAHHEDYTKPLAIIWLCRKHHNEHHKLMSNTSTPIKDFLRKIGSKGGKKSAQHPDRPRLNKEAAIARWRKAIPEPKALPK